MTTDFGADGPYVAAMKGVVLGLAPGTPIVDVSHAIESQNIAEGSYVLSQIVDFFPTGTVHLAVVDPGVGTDRRVIAVEVDGSWFVLPDNGLIGFVLKNREPSRIWEVSNPSIRRPSVSKTFHGRDIMAPAAAHLLRGGDPGELGPALTEVNRLPSVEPSPITQGWLGEVVFRDSFGNLISNITRNHLGSTPADCWQVEIFGQRIDGLVTTYAERLPGTLVALFGSSDRLEVAVVNGDAASVLGARRGTSIQLVRHREVLA
jgi:S-adenosylmethionine hydrolase